MVSFNCFSKQSSSMQRKSARSSSAENKINLILVKWKIVNDKYWLGYYSPVWELGAPEGQICNWTQVLISPLESKIRLELEGVLQRIRPQISKTSATSNRPRSTAGELTPFDYETKELKSRLGVSKPRDHGRKPRALLQDHAFTAPSLETPRGNQSSSSHRNHIKLHRSSPVPVGAVPRRLHSLSSATKGPGSQCRQDA